MTNTMEAKMCGFYFLCCQLLELISVSLIRVVNSRGNKFPGTRSGLDRLRLSAAVLTSCDRQCNCSLAAAAMNGSRPPRCVAWTTPTCTYAWVGAPLVWLWWASPVTFDVCSVADWSLITYRRPHNSEDLMLLRQSYNSLGFKVVVGQLGWFLLFLGDGHLGW